MIENCDLWDIMRCLKKCVIFKYSQSYQSYYFFCFFEIVLLLNSVKYRSSIESTNTI